MQSAKIYLIPCSICLLAAFTLSGAASADIVSPPAQQEERVCPEPTYAEVAYGPHERNRLDFWQATSEKPTPLIIHIHGGGFVEGDKSSVRGRRGKKVWECLDNGVSIASINYRFIQHAGLLDVLHDGARAVQFLRSRAEAWNIDKTRVACFGESAGAGTSLWLAFHDDLADPNNADPVLHESTRLCAAGAIETQATYDFEQWVDMIGVPRWFWNVTSVGAVPAFYRCSSLTLDSAETKKLRHEVDMLGWFDKSDPPIYLNSRRPKDPPQNWDHMLHHPGHALAVKAKADALGVSAILIDCDTPQDQDKGVLPFLLEKLGVTAAP